MRKQVSCTKDNYVWIKCDFFAFNIIAYLGLEF